MFRNTIIFLLLACNSLCFAQNDHTADSLEVVLKTAPDDTHKVSILNRLAEEYQSDDPDKALPYANNQLTLAEQLSYQKGIAQAYKTIAYIHINKGEYDRAIEFNLKALKLYEQLKDKKAISSSLNYMGMPYYYMKNYDKALDYWEQSLALDKEIGDESGISKMLNNIGNVYERLGKNNEALTIFQDALKINKARKDYPTIASNLNNIGNIYDDQKKYDKAIDYYQQSIKIKTELGDKKGIANTFLNISMSYLKLGDYDKSLECIDKGLSIAKEIGNKDRIQEAYVQFADVYSAKKDFEKAFEYQQLAGAMKDSLLNEDITKQIADMDAKYQNGKKEAENKILRTETEKQKVINYSITTGLLLALALTFFIFRAFRQKQKANKLLGEKNVIIQQKNKDITDSINYARRIQDVILPGSETILKALPGHFILYQPRDIVSGDFYWFHEQNGKIIIAAADCTGHGVPGAFVSMVGNNLLNQIVIEKKIYSPGEILSHLNIGIHQAFKKEGAPHAEDGMDISLCTITENKTIEFAGAMNPLVVIRNSEALEIKADKTPIGGSTDTSFRFTTQQITTENNDRFYIFSDGYADQFGGGKNKKLTRKRFKDMLAETSSLSFSDQKKKIHTAFAEWKGKNEQVDDVLVIGFSA